MSLSVVYDMQAHAGEGEAMARALAGLADVVRALPGCGGVCLWRDTAGDERFVFVEAWPSQAAYDAAAGLLPKDAFDPLKPLLAEKPGRRVLAGL